MKKRGLVILAMLALLIISGMLIAGCGKEKAADTTATPRTIVDMAGREVTLPAEIHSLATIGPGPVLNSLIFAVGEGGKIVNGLPDFARSERWKYQHKFAPNISEQPMVQTSDFQPNVEEMLKLKPDVVFTMEARGSCEQIAEVLTNAGLPTVCLVWTEPDEVKQAINMIGEVLHQETRAQEYSKYFDDTIARVSKVVDSIPEDKRPRVLHCNIQSMTAPHAITEWWVSQAGGKSVTKEVRVAENIEFSVEQLLKWDPQVIIVSSPDQVNLLCNDSRFKEVSAVKNKQVFPTPVGAHIWGNRTSEQPLMLLWAAKTFHPEAFKNLNLEEELIQFYKHFFNYSMNVEEAQEILGGGPKVDPGKKK
ncbi:MAG: ABC transporter substrate-binding protein [Syntrophomonas sp.]|uniref:ABC transporter substrate-binding protein n=1 Tax=Syntrophomonas sp. TaxID=2053627 RepID=UPI00263979B3|nr:ABC transporter substrate-binding protein [Syntrophomonas sp.]MDD2511265.1 ABC transporter substrate-binding protein [Syntrophomonas sp.]MDD4627234.1 ABC transporter substrate-binding protein [Syntrophomonas sp.]